MTHDDQAPHATAPTTESAGDPLSDLAAAAVERTASPRDPEAIPPVAGAADPQVLDSGLTASPVTNEKPAPPEEDEDGRKDKDGNDRPAGA